MPEGKRPNQLEERPGGGDRSPLRVRNYQRPLTERSVRLLERCRAFARWWWNLAQGHSLHLVVETMATVD